MADPKTNEQEMKCEEERESAGIAIRRHGDRCFHEVEEMVFSAGCGGGCGYIVDGIMVMPEDVAEMVSLDAQGAAVLSCKSK